MSDGELIGRYRDQRLPDDFAEIVRRHSGRLLGYLARCVGDVSMAEDVLQDTFLQVHAKCDLYQDGWPARPWLYSIAAHRAVDAMRRSRRLPSIRLDATITSREPGSLAENLEGGEADPHERLEQKERFEHLEQCVANLPEWFSQVVSLAYYGGLRYDEIADVLDIPLGTVKSRMHGAIAKLRVMFNHK